MMQLKYIWNVSALATLVILVSACGPKKFSSDQASTGAAQGVTNPGGGTPGTGDTGTGGGDPGTVDNFLTKDQCFNVLTYDVAGPQNDANSVVWTSNADCAEIVYYGYLGWGAANPFSYDLYHTTPAQTLALVQQVTGVANPTTADLQSMRWDRFRQLLVGSTIKPFQHVTGSLDDIY